MIGGGIYPGMVTATVGTVALIAVVFTSIVIVKRRLCYEWWHAVHLLAYAGIALAWFHQIPTGNELVLDQAAADYWRSLDLATRGLLVGYRLVAPGVAAFRHRLRVAGVRREGPGVVSRHTGSRRGPFGTFTAAAARRPKSLLIAGGIGITPIRALLEELHGDVVVV
jgi:predicted ferric reductase